MALESVQGEILHSLSDLDEEGLDWFRLKLQDASVKPRIRAADVEGKNRAQITKLLLSRCTEAGAVSRTVQTLRDIGRNNEASQLERRNVPRLTEAPSVSEPGSSSSTAQANGSVKTPQRVTKKRAKAMNPETSEQRLLFGKHRGQSFEWLLQNDVNYVGFLVASHQKQRNEGDKSQTPMMKQKDALAEYVRLFPEAMEEVQFYLRGQEPLGFGKYKKVTRKDLYESEVDARKKHVEWLRSRKTFKNQQMEEAVKYVLRRDKKRTSWTWSRAEPAAKASALPHDLGPSLRDRIFMMLLFVLLFVCCWAFKTLPGKILQLWLS